MISPLIQAVINGRKPSPPSNAISRNSALGAAPAYENTTNVTGAQTAQAANVAPQRASSSLFAHPMQRMGVQAATATSGVPNAPYLPQHFPSVDLNAGVETNYAGGNVAGIAQYYRNSALQQYGQVPAAAGQLQPGTSPTPQPGLPFSPLANAGMLMAGVPAMPVMGLPRMLENSPVPPEEPIQSRSLALGGISRPAQAMSALFGANLGNQPAALASAIGLQALTPQGNTATAINDRVRQTRQDTAPPSAVPETAQQTLERIQATNAERLGAQEAARQQNTRGFQLDQNRIRPDQKQMIAENSALRTAGGGAAADPTNLAGRMAGFGAAPGSTWYDRYEQAQVNQERADRAVRAEARYNSPEKVKERADRAALKETPEYKQKMAAAKQQRESALEDYKAEHEGLSRREVRLAEQYRRLGQQQVRAGRISKDEADARLAYHVDRMQSGNSAAKKSVLGDAAVPESQLPVKKQLSPQSPEKAKENVTHLSSNNKFIQHQGWTPDTTPDQFVADIARLDPASMNSDQKFEAARAYHDYALSQVESLNPAWKPGTDENNPYAANGLLNGLNTMMPGNRDAMIRWFDDFVERSRQSYGAANIDMFGNPTQVTGDKDFTFGMPGVSRQPDKYPVMINGVPR